MMTICITNMINSMSFAIGAPFLPIEADRKNVSQDWMGPVFALFGLAGALSAQQAGYLVSKLNRKNIMIIGLTLFVLANVFTALLFYIESANLFLAGIVASRILLGASYGFIITTSKITNISICSSNNLVPKWKREGNSHEWCS